MHYEGRIAQLKLALHPRLDPLLSLPDHWRARLRLLNLPDGTYRTGVTVPYYSQFASPDLVYDYIHGGFDGTTDPQWRVFGARDPADYAFWAPRVCALTVLKMAIEAFRPARPTLWELVREGLKLNGYTLRDANGNWIDQGWYVEAQIALAARYGMLADPHGYVSPLSVCTLIREGWLVGATVTPDLGERTPTTSRYGGHMVLVHGFEWKRGQPVAFLLHNPSGRYAELRTNARIPAARFYTSFAHRLVALRPLPAVAGTDSPKTRN